jgi:hypothetical protein
VCAYLLFWLRIQVCNALQCLCGSNCAARWTHQCLVYNSPFKCWERNCLMPIIWWQQHAGGVGEKGRLMLHDCLSCVLHSCTVVNGNGRKADIEFHYGC